MRRRQIFAAQNAATNAPIPYVPRVDIEKEEPRKVGQCPKCRKIIGRKLFFHMKACNA